MTRSSTASTWPSAACATTAATSACWSATARARLAWQRLRAGQFLLQQVRGQGAQRGELATDVRQLGLYQAMAVVHVLGHLLQFLGQRFLLFAVDGDRAFLFQARGDFLEAGGEPLGGALQEAVAGVLGQAFAVRAEAG